jgi:hypothetical protein
MSSCTLRRSARLGLIALLDVTFTLAFAAALQAQVLSDPRIAEFDPSPDHWVVLDSGESAVLRYELNVYLVGASAPFATVNMGKPSPDTDGKIRYDFSSQVAAWSLPGGDYDARVSAIGPEGAALSDPSNPFTFTTNSTCSFSLNAAAVSAPAAGGSYAVSVSTGAGCTWGVTTALSWVTLGTAGGSGSGTVPFTVQANSSSSSRTGIINIGGQALTVSQAGATASTCSYSLSPTSVSMTATGGSASFTVTAGTGCSWSAATSDSWITIAGGSGSGTGAVSLTVAPSAMTTTRTGTVSVQGRIFTVTQTGAAQATAGSSCSYSLSPTYVSMPAAGGDGTVEEITDPGCAWTVASSQSWLVPAVKSGTGSARLTFTVKANNGVPGRTAQLTVGPWVVWVSQSGKLRQTK